MKKLLVCLLAVFTVSLFAQGIHWQHDFDKALDLSRKSRKPVFVFFTGSDWCGWCIKLDREILSKRDMVRFLNDNFILYKADFPKRNQPPRHVMAKNQHLMKRYGVRGYPTIVIVDGNGKSLGMTGYMRGGPDAMKRELGKYIRKAPPRRDHGPQAAPHREPQKGPQAAPHSGPQKGSHSGRGGRR